DNDSKHCSDQHPSCSCHSNRPVTYRSSSRCHTKWNQTCNKRKGCHQNWSKTLTCTFNRCFYKSVSFFVTSNRKLYNQNGVFRKQTNQHNKCYLCVDIVIQSHKY